MEEIPAATVYRGYWRRRKGYERLNGGGKPRRKTRFWRAKLTRRLKLKLRFSPKKLLQGLRNAYVNMMMRIANTRMIGGGFGGGCGGGGISGFGLGREYNHRLILDTYKSIVAAQGQQVPRDGTWICSEITCRQ